MVRKHGYAELHVFKRKGRPSQTMARPKKKRTSDRIGKASGGKLALEGRECVAKKVKTLVEEQEARTRFNGQKPSMN